MEPFHNVLQHIYDQHKAYVLINNIISYQAAFAQQYGAVGLILYGDPSDYAKGDSVYPNSWWLPDTGVQRGSLFMMGDPQTQGYPSTG